MSTAMELLAKQLSDKGVILTLKNNSVFEYANTVDNQRFIVGKIGDKILNEVSNIKNNYLPYYKKYVELVSDTLNSSMGSSDIAKYNIVQVSLSDAIKGFKNKGIIRDNMDLDKLPSSVYNFDIPEVADIRAYFSYEKDAELNIRIEDLIASRSDDDLLAIWNRWLVNVNSSNGNYLLLSNRDVFNPDDILLAYCALDKLSDNKPSYIEDSDASYVTNLAIFKSWLLNYISLAIRFYNNDVEIGRLILKRSEDRYSLYVNSDLYTQFLNSNGNADALLGYLVSTPMDTTNVILSDVLAKQDEYVKSFNYVVQADKLATAQNEIKRYKVAYSLAMSKLLKDELPESILTDMGVEPSSILKGVDEILSVLSEEYIRNISKTAQILTSRLIFVKGMYSEFTDSMIAVSEENPDIDPKDAASYTCIKILINYLLDQIDVYHG